MAAHPADLMSRIADYKSIGLDVFSDHRTGADKAVFSERCAANKGRIGPDGGPSFKNRFLVLSTPVYGASRIVYVGEHHARAEKDIVFANHAGINAHIVLDFDIAAEHYVWADDDVLSEVAAGADFSALHHVAEMPDFCSRSDFCSWVDDSSWMKVFMQSWV